MAEDEYAERWKQRKLQEMKKLLSEKAEEGKGEEMKLDWRKTLSSVLTGRGPEVFKAAEKQHPKAALSVGMELARLIHEGRVAGPITGETLYQLFRSLGIRVRLDTEIVYLEHGEKKTIGEKMRGE